MKHGRLFLFISQKDFPLYLPLLRSISLAFRNTSYIMKIRLVIIFITFIGSQVKSQNIEKFAEKICDAVSQTSMNNKDSLEVILEQVKIQNAILQDTTLVLDLAIGNLNNNLNVFNYKLNRTLNKSCPQYKITNSALFGLNPVLDMEGILGSSEIDSIESSTRDLRKQINVGIVIITIDDFYPYTNIGDYAKSQGNNWHMGSEYKKGGIVLVISKSLRQVQISTSHISKKYLTDEECQEIINNTLIPRFKAGEYYQAIQEFISDVKIKM